MTVSGVNTPTYVQYQQKPSGLVKVNDYPSHQEYVYETEATTGKKWGVGIASAFVNGLGQAINGEWGKAAGFFFGGLVVPATIAILSRGKSAAAFWGAGVASLGINIWSIVDAVKNAKSTTSEIVRK